jgi:hypothetical protein
MTSLNTILIIAPFMDDFGALVFPWQLNKYNYIARYEFYTENLH